jgi:hypothetical protein
MVRTSLLLIAASLLATTAVAAPSGKARAPAHRPAPKPLAAAPAHPAAASAGTDSTDPATMIAVLQGAGAKAQAARKDVDGVLVTVTSPLANFSVQYAQCDPQGRGCKAAVLDSQAAGSPSLVQINGYNQASAMCRGYMDKSGKAHVVMSMLLFATDTHERLVTELAAWQGCLADFGSFARDPVAYLANAP